MALFCLGLLVFTIVTVAGVQCMYPSNSDVIDLTPSNFDKLVLRDDAIWVVEFYAPWCGHCQSLKPEYEKAAKALKVQFEYFHYYANNLLISPRK